jgi:hypothetical protein
LLSSRLLELFCCRAELNERSLSFHRGYHSALSEFIESLYFISLRTSLACAICKTERKRFSGKLFSFVVLKLSSTSYIGLTGVPTLIRVRSVNNIMFLYVYWALWTIYSSPKSIIGFGVTKSRRNTV